MSSEVGGLEPDSHPSIEFDPDVKWPEINQVYRVALQYPVND